MPAKPLFLLVLPLAAAVHAAPLSYRTVTLEARANCAKTEKEAGNGSKCHELNVAYPKTGDKALDAWALRRIQKAVGTSNLTPKGLQAYWARNGEVKAVNESNAEGGDTPCHLDYNRSIELQGQTPHYAVFGGEYWDYACGPHGNGVYDLAVVRRDAAKPQALALKDILLHGGRARLDRLQKEAAAEHLAKYRSDDVSSVADARRAIDEYTVKDFKGTDNWRLAKGGLLFVFQSYEITPYVLGRPEAYIPAAKLKGIVKPEILREAAHYQIAPKILKEDKNAK